MMISLSVHVLPVANRGNQPNTGWIEINAEHHFFLSDLDPTARP